MKTVLVSGFGKFGDYLDNSSCIVARNLNKHVIGEDGKYQIESCVFDGDISTIKDRGLTLLDRAWRGKHSAIISLGMDCSTKGLKVESQATNYISDRRFCSKHINGTAVNRNLNLGANLPMDLEQWNLEKFYETCRKKHIPFESTSTNAGNFSCNQLMFQVRALQLSKKMYAPIPFIFIHIPCSPLCLSREMEKKFKEDKKITLISSEVTRGLRVLLNGLQE